MINISGDAAEIIRKKGDTVYLDLPKIIRTCCMDFQECPTVRFGSPSEREGFETFVVDGINVFVPRNITDMQLSIAVSSFLGFRKLVVEGWHYCF